MKMDIETYVMDEKTHGYGEDGLYIFVRRSELEDERRLILLPLRHCSFHDFEEAVREIRTGEADIDSLAAGWVSDDGGGARYGVEAQAAYNIIREEYEKGAASGRMFLGLDVNIPEPPPVAISRQQYIDMLAHLAQTNEGCDIIAKHEGPGFAADIAVEARMQGRGDSFSYDWEGAVRAALKERDKAAAGMSAPGSTSRTEARVAGAQPSLDAERAVARAASARGKIDFVEEQIRNDQIGIRLPKPDTAR
jgi:hypothetical protein